MANPRKRVKGSLSKESYLQYTVKEPEKSPPSRVFVPFRSIGHVCNQVPFDIQVRGTQFILTTCIGRAIQTYGCAKLNLLFVGSQTEYDITGVVSKGDTIYATLGPFIVGYKRGKEAFRLKQSSNQYLGNLLVFGNYICATSINSSCKELIVFDLQTQEIHAELPLNFEGEVSAILHPPTYLNKVLIGTTNGTLEIWNVRTGKLVFRTPSFASPITALAASPAVDVVACGCLDGTITVYHLRAAETIMTLRQEGRANSLSFRTDGQHILASANNVGDIAFWNLEKGGKITHVLRGAHNGSIPSIEFLSGQPVLLSTGTDNSIKQWIFDSLDGVPRLLKSRSGHHAPPTSIQFYGTDSHYLLSASRDRSLRGFSLFSDSQNFELSQGNVVSSINKMMKSSFASVTTAQDRQQKLDEAKLPEIVAIASSLNREKDWDNILTAHKDDSAARSWTWKSKRLGIHQFKTLDLSPVKSVCISACGNFGMVGSSKGSIACFNMQSGLLRRSYPSKLERSVGHTKAVTGIVSDTLNKYLFTSSLDGSIKFWDFAKGSLQHTLNCGSGVTFMKYHPTSDLLSISCDDLSIKVVDTETHKVIRELIGHSNRVTSIAFSNDGRWLVSAALDSTIRTWDLPTGHCIDAIRTPAICTSLTFSGSGEYLATSHVDSVGLHIWTNKAQFAPISTRAITEDEIMDISMPSASGEGGVGSIQAALNVEKVQLAPSDTTFISVDQLSQDLLTMSMLPKSRWQNLLNLDLIKMRNKPTEAPKQPEKLPFDLGTLRALQKGKEEGNELAKFSGSESRHMKVDQVSGNSSFTEHLHNANDSHNSTAFIAYLKTLGPSATDMEIRSLSLASSFKELIIFLNAMTWRLSEKKDYELVQVWVNTFLKAHGDVLAQNMDCEALESALLNWKEIQEQEAERLNRLVGYCSGVVRFLSNKQ